MNNVWKKVSHLMSWWHQVYFRKKKYPVKSPGKSWDLETLKAPGPKHLGTYHVQKSRDLKNKKSPGIMETLVTTCNQSYVIKSAPWTILWFRILGIFSVEYIKRLCVFMFQTCSNSQLLRRVLWISAEQTIGASLKHKYTQPLYIFKLESSI